MAEFLTDNNIAIASANYRLYPDAVFPDFIRDAAAAVAWVFKNIGEYGKCDKIFVGGTSAGAYLSMMLCYDKKWLAKYRISPMDIAGFLHNSGQPTTHFNVLRERGMDYRRVVIDEAAPIYYLGADGNECPPMLHVCATNDMPGRQNQLKMMMTTMEHLGYDMSKIELRELEGRHVRYTDVKLQDMIKEFVEKN
ncbi:MAG: alpha/beta hydrolase [Clostridia bacterium]|nr:alpha/beta hydrolase [Clostridia bacterium]